MPFGTWFDRQICLATGLFYTEQRREYKRIANELTVVLLIDADEGIIAAGSQSVRRLLTTVLTGFGLNVRLANGEAEVVAIFRSEAVHFVFLGVQIPETDGLRILTVLQVIDRQVICCFMSPSAGPFGLTGAARLLREPFSLGELWQPIVDVTRNDDLNNLINIAAMGSTSFTDSFRPGNSARADRRGMIGHGPCHAMGERHF